MHKRTIVITGVSRGLGYALARRYAEQGHAVYGCAPAQHGPGGGVHYTQLDITDSRLVAEWGKQIVEQTPVDLLVNNAGIIMPQTVFWCLPQDKFDLTIRTNVNGTANVIRTFLPSMVKRQKGIILNILSGGAKQCLHGSAAYNTSKWAIEGLTKTLAKELPEGVAVIGVMPGATNTFMLRRVIGKDALKTPSIEDWIDRAAPFILQIPTSMNGKIVTIPSSE